MMRAERSSWSREDSAREGGGGCMASYFWGVLWEMLQLNPSLWLCLLLQLRFLIPLHPNIIEAEALIRVFGSLPPPLWNLLGFFLWSKRGEPPGSALQAGDRAWAWWHPGGPPLAMGIPFLVWPLFSCCLTWLFGLLCYKLQANTQGLVDGNFVCFKSVWTEDGKALLFSHRTTQKKILRSTSPWKRSSAILWGCNIHSLCKDSALFTLI